MAYNTNRVLDDNIAAIRTALEYQPGQSLDPEAQAILKKYAGFGGIKAILFPVTSNDEDWAQRGATKDDIRLRPSIQALHELLHAHFTPEEYQGVVFSLQNSVLSSFYTPSVVATTLYTVLKALDLAPGRIYEPSAGAGAFVHEAFTHFPTLSHLTAVEKDTLTARVLAASCAHLPRVNAVHEAFEQTTVQDNATYDLIISNIPFGNFNVYDPAIRVPWLSSRIHNYFFAKGLDKIRDGGLLAYITTDAFLNTPANQTVREYVFEKADFIALCAMPDNLMKDTGNTEAPNHLLIVQRNDRKTSLSLEEEMLTQTTTAFNQFGTYDINLYLSEHPELIVGNRVEAGKNQYGKAHQVIWQDGPMRELQAPLEALLTDGIGTRIDRSRYRTNAAIQQAEVIPEVPTKQLHLRPMPENSNEGSNQQLGLFDTVSAEQINRASAYINELDATVVQKDTGRILAIVSTVDHPLHECVVLITAKQHKQNRYLYKLYSNVEELQFSANWGSGESIAAAVRQLSGQLKEYDHEYRFQGDPMMEPAFNLKRPRPGIYEHPAPFYKKGTLVVHEGVVGRIGAPDEQFTQAPFEPLPAQTSVAFYDGYIQLRDAYLQLMQREMDGGQVAPEHRQKVLEKYETFTLLYGALNQAANAQRIQKDEAFGFMILSSLERKQDEKFVPADILTASVRPQQAVFTTNDPAEALARSLNDYGKVHLDFIQSATGLTEQEAIEQLEKLIYLNPSTSEWETVDRFLSGNVVAKLKAAEAICEEHPGHVHYQRSLEALSRIQPEPIPFDLLEFNLGERWIPLSYYQSFASALFENTTDIHLLRSIDVFKVVPDIQNAKITAEFAVTPKSGPKMMGHHLLEHALENTTPYFTYEESVGEGKTIRLPDNDAIQLAAQKIESIRSRFGEWLSALPITERDELTRLYNETYNCYVLREYDGSHLSFPGLQRVALEITDLWDSQKSAAWRLIQDRGGIIDHEVGLGKTLTFIVASWEMKRLGIIRKPVILALKANVSQIVETYRTAYPQARILAPTETDYTPDKRLKLFYAIKNNNWDAIIMTHDQFSKIPQDPEIMRQILQTELHNLEQDLKTLGEQGGSITKRILKGLEVRKNNLKNELKQLTQRIEEKKDQEVTFHEMGIDHLFIDEAHKFKNLTFTTRHNRVAGLGNTEGSQKALNLLFAIRTLQQRFNADLCATFLSGTPISNSLTEMYLLFKYLRPQELARQQIDSFDAWAAVYAKKTTDFEFSITNEIMAKERFRHFIKVPELQLFYNEITDYKTAKHIQLDRPELDEQLVNIPPTTTQQALLKKLIQFAKTGEGALIGRPPLSREEDKSRMLIATNYAKKMATDIRLVDESLPDEPGNKIGACARKLADHYRDSHVHKGTQIVFCDIGTPKPDQFNVYDALKRKLIEDFQIPAQEISFIHDWTDKKKPELFKKMNRGEIRILLGSTDKAGTGLNVQRRIVAMHHLDIPWKPSEFEQRNGRGARKGNIIAKEHYGNKVKNYIYAVEKTLDNYKFNLLRNKQTFISQMKTGSLHVRSIDEGAMDEKSGMNFSEYIAILSGDTTLLEKTKLDKKIAVLEGLRAAHYKELSRTRYRLQSMQAKEQESTLIVAKMATDEQVYTSQLRYEKDQSKSNPLELIHCPSHLPEVTGKYLIDLFRNYTSPERQVEEKIGSLYGFDVMIQGKREYHMDSKGKDEYRYTNAFFIQHPESFVKYFSNDGQPNIDNPKLAARIFINALDRIAAKKAQEQEALAVLRRDIPMLQKVLDTPFEKEAELAEWKQEASNLEQAINLKIKEAKMTREETVNVPPATEEVVVFKADAREAILEVIERKRIIGTRDQVVDTVDTIERKRKK